MARQLSKSAKHAFYRCEKGTQSALATIYEQNILQRGRTQLMEAQFMLHEYTIESHTRHG